MLAKPLCEAIQAKSIDKLLFRCHPSVCECEQTVDIANAVSYMGGIDCQTTHVGSPLSAFS